MKSPLKDQPLRNPGQSLDEKLRDFAFDSLFYLCVAVMITSVAVVEWIRHLTNSPPTPVVWTVIAFVSAVVAALKVRPIISKALDYKLGRDGEKIVGQHLETLRADGAHIFHDVLGTVFNIDHVVVSTNGIFVIETKTWRKPNKGNAKIEFDGVTLKRNGSLVIDDSPTEQAARNSKYLSDIISASTGQKFDVQPIATFPGWFVEQTNGYKNNRPWILNPKAIPSFISKSKINLPASDVSLVAHHLSRHILFDESK